MSIGTMGVRLKSKVPNILSYVDRERFMRELHTKVSVISVYESHLSQNMIGKVASYRTNITIQCALNVRSFSVMHTTWH